MNLLTKQKLRDGYKKTKQTDKNYGYQVPLPLFSFPGQVLVKIKGQKELGLLLFTLDLLTYTSM